MMGMANTDADTAADAVSNDASAPAVSRAESRVTPRGEDRRQAIIDAAAALRTARTVADMLDKDAGDL